MGKKSNDTHAQESKVSRLEVNDVINNNIDRSIIQMQSFSSLFYPRLHFFFDPFGFPFGPQGFYKNIIIPSRNSFIFVLCKIT